MGLFLVFGILVFGTILLASIFKAKFEVSLPTFILSSVVIIYISGLIGSLLIGYYLIIIAGLAGLILFIKNVIKKEDRTLLLERILTPGFIIFIIAFVFISVINMYKSLMTWDDFSHWGPMVKDLLRLDKFYNTADAVLGVHRDYPPAIQLFEYFFCKLAGGFSEPNIFRALQLMTIAFIIPVFKDIKKNYIKLIIISVIMLLLADTVGISLYENVYIDATIGVMFGYGLFLAITNKKSSLFFYFNLFLICFTLIITKQIGIFFAGMILFVLGIRMLLELKGIILNKEDRKRKLIYYLVSFLIGLFTIALAYFSWNIVLKSTNADAEAQFNISDISINKFFQILVGNGEEYQNITFNNFYNAIFKTPIIKMFNLSYFSILLLVFFIGLGFYIKLKDSEYRNFFLAFVISIPIIAVLYAIVMLLLYLFCFGSYEGTGLASYDRYMPTLWIGIITAMFMSLTRISSEIEKNGKSQPLMSLATLTVLCGIICAVIVPAETYINIIKGILPQEDITNVFMQENSELFKNNILGKDKVYLIIQGSKGMEYWKAKYYSFPIITNNSFTWSIAGNAFEGDIWSQDVSSEEWEKTLREEYDYVYIMKIDEAFTERYKALFEVDSVPEEKKLYKVEKTNDESIVLKLVK